MYYNRNLITAAEHPVTREDASGVFNLQSQAVNQNQKEWPGSETASIIYDLQLPADSLTIEIRSAGTVNYTIDWGDGTVEASEDNLPSHTYSAAGTYKVKIFSDVAYRPYLNGKASLQKTLLKIEITENAVLGTTLEDSFKNMRAVHTFVCPFAVTSNVVNFHDMLGGCSVLGNVSFFNTSSGTNFGNMFYANKRSFYPNLNTANATDMGGMFRSSEAIELPALSTSNVTGFSQSFRGCPVKTFPSYDFSAASNFTNAWRDGSVVNFPANMFDNAQSPLNLSGAFRNNDLTAQSIENILTSLVTNGQTGITTDISSGGNAAYSTWSSAAQTALTTLQSRSWNITYNT